MTVGSTKSTSPRPSLALVAAAFAALYLIWGSTYVAIKFAIDTLPPFLMAGTRYFSAGIVLWLIMRGRDRCEVTRANWRAAIVIGVLLLMGGNGLVTFAEQYVASSLVALLIATVPLWLVALDWLFCRGPRPTALMIVGLGIGLFGVYLLIGPSAISGSAIHPVGAVCALSACVFWSIGSLYSRKAPLPKSAFTATWMEMLGGGGAMLLLGTALGEWSRVDFAAISLKSLLAVAYLSIFGSIVALTAYTWLLKVSTPARVGTYAYVNPVVAMALGALVANEPLSGRVLVAAAVILAAVVMITLSKARQVSAVLPDASASLDRSDLALSAVPAVASVVSATEPVVCESKPGCADTTC